ncbi:unnamed protein product, partial [Polarella glacialis]
FSGDSVCLDRSDLDLYQAALRIDQKSPEASLSKLLEEKRRLLQRVSAKLGETAVNAVLGCGAPPVRPQRPPEESEAPSDLRSLCTNLRDGIERKRTLLEQLQLGCG